MAMYLNGHFSQSMNAIVTAYFMSTAFDTVMQYIYCRKKMPIKLWYIMFHLNAVHPVE